MSQIVGRASIKGHDAMLEGLHLSPGNRYAYTMSVYNYLVHSKLGGRGAR